MTNARYRHCLIWGDEMKSIDNLRDYALTAPAASMGSMARAIVAGMADEIEREVKELTDEREFRGVKVGTRAGKVYVWREA